MNLGKEINYLLKKQNRVFVKGLGTFSRIHDSATYDPNRKVYLPPISYVEFDGQSTDGFDFVYYLQQSLAVSYEEAANILSSEISIIHTKISEQGTYVLSPLGQLIPYGNNLVFKPEDLTGFQFEPIDASTIQPIQPPVEQQTAVQEESLEAASHVEPVLPVENEDNKAALDEMEDEDEPVKESKGAFWYLVITFLAIIAIVVSYFIYQDQLAQNQPPVVDSKSTIQDSIPQVNEPIDTTGVHEVDSLRDTLLTPAVDSTLVNHIDADLPHRYQIVIATPPTLEQAEKIAEKYHEKGFLSVKVIPSNMARNKKRVIWKTFATKHEADSALLYVQKNHVKDAWLNTLKN